MHLSEAAHFLVGLQLAFEVTQVPEVDAGWATGAVALLAGGYLIFVSRVRRKKKVEDR